MQPDAHWQVLPAWPAALIVTSVLLGRAILAQQVIVNAAGSVSCADEARGMGLGAAEAAGRVGSLAGPLFSAVLLASGATLPCADSCRGHGTQSFPLRKPTHFLFQWGLVDDRSLESASRYSLARAQ
jgi:hypothetical protein